MSFFFLACYLRLITQILSLESGSETIGVSGAHQKKEVSIQAAYDAYYNAYYHGAVQRVPPGDVDDFPHPENSDNEDEDDEDKENDGGSQHEVISISSDSDED